MGNLQGDLQAAIRAITGTTGQWGEDWHALLDKIGFRADMLSERILKYYGWQFGDNSNSSSASALNHFLLNNSSVLDGAYIDLAYAVDSRIAFTRGSIGTYFDQTGTMQTAAIDVARIDYDPVSLQSRGLLIEESRTNLLLNSETASTQGVEVTAQPYTLSFYGTGSVVLSGAASATINGTGAYPTRTISTFTPGAGTLTLTPSGTVTKWQLEAGGFATSYIPTVGAAVTRALDNAVISTLGSIAFSQSAGSWYAEVLIGQLTSAARVVSDTVGSISFFETDTSGHVGTWNGSALLATANMGAVGATIKAAMSYDGTGRAICLNSGAVATDVNTIPGITAIALGRSQANDQMLNGWIKSLRYIPRKLSGVELQALTA